MNLGMFDHLRDELDRSPFMESDVYETQVAITTDKATIGNE
ncbi:hypothetical protein [Rossellomorea aquimaris]|nr:hypothetical protein [Rossellomorea aquimaris]